LCKCGLLNGEGEGTGGKRGEARGGERKGGKGGRVATVGAI